MKKFNDYKISNEILKALDALGYKEPSDVQRMVIPEVLNGKDVVVKSESEKFGTLLFKIR